MHGSCHDTGAEVSGILAALLQEERNTAHLVLHQLHNLGKPLLLRGEVQDAFAHLRASGNADDLAGTPVEQMLQMTQEAVVNADWLYLALRIRVGRWGYLRINSNMMSVEDVPVSEFLRVKEHLVDAQQARRPKPAGRCPGPKSRVEYEAGHHRQL